MQSKKKVIGNWYCINVIEKQEFYCYCVIMECSDRDYMINQIKIVYTQMLYS